MLRRLALSDRENSKHPGSKTYLLTLSLVVGIALVLALVLLYCQ